MQLWFHLELEFRCICNDACLVLVLCLTFLMGHEPLQIPVQNTTAAIGTIWDLHGPAAFGQQVLPPVPQPMPRELPGLVGCKRRKNGWNGWWFDDGSWLIHHFMNACILNLLKHVWSVLHLDLETVQGFFSSPKPGTRLRYSTRHPDAERVFCVGAPWALCETVEPSAPLPEGVDTCWDDDTNSTHDSHDISTHDDTPR